MNKKIMVNTLAKIQASNWISSGDKMEDDRNSLERFGRRNFSNYTVMELKNTIQNITIIDNDLESSIDFNGIR